MHASRLLAAVSCVAFVALAPIASGQAPAGPATAQAPAKVPVVVDPAKVSFGKIKPESINPAVFKVTNVGSAPLKIVKATPSCKCTAITPVEGKVIAPGETIEISASLKAPSVPGERDAKVFVMFEGYKAPVILELVGDVTMDIACEPAFVDALKEKKAGTIKVRSLDGKPFRILSAGGARPSFKPGTPTDADGAKSDYEVQWTVEGLTTMPIWWVVETDRPGARLLPLRVRHETTGSKWDMARFERQWHLKDGLVFVGAVEVGKSVEHTLELEYYNPPSNDPSKVRPKKPNWSTFKAVSVADPSVKVEVVEHKMVGDSSLEVKIRVTGVQPKTLNVDCIIETETGRAVMPLIATVVPAGG